MATQDSYSSSFDNEKAPAVQVTTQNADLSKLLSQLLPANGGTLQPGLHRNIRAQKRLANPSPLGLCAFALTTFVVSSINLNVMDVTAPNLVVGLAYGYGGLIQLLAGMWEMAVGNTFGATALSSYGGFWIAFAIILSPQFGIVDSYTNAEGVSDFDKAFAIYLYGWFVFTTVMVLLTLRSTVAFFSLFLCLDMTFLFLALSRTYATTAAAAGLQKTGGVFGMLAAFLAWYNAFAGIANSSNFFFRIPTVPFPWSDEKRHAHEHEHEHHV